LAPYKVPKTVEFIELIPRSEAMKLSRAAFVAERDDPDDAGAGVGPGARSGS
jgi:bile acid-coenzyme A ligase